MAEGIDERWTMTPNARLRLAERREIHLPPDVALEALLGFDRHQNGWLWRATEHAVSVRTDPAPVVVVKCLRSAAEGVAEMRFGAEHVGAALIHFCWVLRIPIPRQAQKEIRITDQGVTLVMSQMIEGPRLHLASVNANGLRPKAPTPS